MNVEDIKSSESTLSEALSKRLFKELFTTTTWRLYGSSAHADVDWWIDRYLKNHARIPSFIRGPGETRILVHAAIPLHIFRWRHGDLLGEGALFANGAVVFLSRPQAAIKLLFVDETTAAAHHYPPTFVQLEDIEGMSS